MISCLRAAGVDVVERHVAVWERRRDAWAAGIAVGLRLAAAEARLLRARVDGDAVLVGYPGQLDVPVARRIARRRPLVFNPLVSLYDTLVSDRGRFTAGSVAARALATLDRRAFAAADRVVADTATHAEFLSGLAGHDRFDVCFVGAEDRLFRPPWQPRDPFTALFVGKLIPLQGIATILEAARLAPEIRFRVIGSGQLERLLRDRPPNVEHVPWVDYELLPDELRSAGCALGIFGTTAKAARVIPNKAFQALASGVPLVTEDSPAARELLVDGESALLVPPGNPHALAEAVRALVTDDALARRIGAGGRTAYERQASEAVLGPRWRSSIERVL